MRRSVFATLVSLALAAAPALAQERDLPGDVPDVDAVVAGLKSDEDPERLSAAERALQVAHDAVTTPLTRLLTDDRYEIRSAALRALGARTTEKAKKAAAKAVAARLPKLSKSARDEGELAIAVQALHDLAQRSTVPALLKDVEDSASDEIFRARVMAVANVPHADAVDELIQLLSGRGRGKWQGQKRSVVEALRSATGEDLGGDPDEWRAWWRDAKRTFDFEAAARRRAEGAERDRERTDRKRERGDRRRKKDSGDSG
jgi:HEAT repeat protein